MRALIKELTSICRHLLLPLASAPRALNSGNQLDGIFYGHCGRTVHRSIAPSHLAAQPGKCLCPFSLVARLSRAEVDSQRAELRGARGLRCASIDVAAPGDLEIHEPRRDDGCLQLCIQQSAGDSTLPEIDVLLALFRYCLLHHNVADLKATARLENTRHFLESGKLVGKEVEDPVRDNHVGPTVGHGK